MMVIAVGALIAHIVEAATCVYYCKVKFKMQPGTIILWGLNVLIVGIFGKPEKMSIFDLFSRNTIIIVRLLGAFISSQVPDNSSGVLQNTSNILPKFIESYKYT